jgi:hypothetical protein
MATKKVSRSRGKKKPATARAAVLRRVPDEAFAAEARRRGFGKLTARFIPVPLSIVDKLSGELEARVMRTINEPANTPMDLNTIRAMMNAAAWLKTHRDVHHEELRRARLYDAESESAQ